MANSKKLAAALEARQQGEHVFVEISQPQLAASLVANGGLGYIEVDVPENGVLVGGSIVVGTAFDGTTAPFSIGDSASQNRYVAAVDLKSAARTVLVPTGYVYGASGNQRKMRLVYAPTGTPTAVGKATLHLQFLQVGKSMTTRGNSSPPSAPPNPGPNV